MFRKLAALLLPAAALCLLASLLAAAPPAAPDPCASNLKRLGLSLSAYTQDYDGDLPPMQSSKVASQALAPYAPGPAVFQCPVTHTPYRPNPLLSSQMLAKVTTPGAADLFADAVPHPDGRTTHLYADGHIAHVRAHGGHK